MTLKGDISPKIARFLGEFNPQRGIYVTFFDTVLSHQLSRQLYIQPTFLVENIQTDKSHSDGIVIMV